MAADFGPPATRLASRGLVDPHILYLISARAEPLPVCSPHSSRACSRLPATRCAGQVGSSGGIWLVSGVGAKGTSAMTLSGGRGLGPDGAQRLAELLQKAPPPLLTSLSLRLLPPLPTLHHIIICSKMWTYC